MKDIITSREELKAMLDLGKRIEVDRINCIESSIEPVDHFAETRNFAKTAS